MLSFLSQRLLRLPGRVLRLAGPLLLVGGLLAGLIGAGRWALEQLRARERYQLPFAAIECPAPPGQERGDFLTEVQYLGGLPDKVALLDDDLPARLSAAFARHPWVERVERVEVHARQVRVLLVFRTPVLVVGRYQRVVDRNGVLLPATASAQGLPVLSQPVKPPAGPAGTPWGDSRVETAARGAGVGKP